MAFAATLAGVDGDVADRRRAGRRVLRVDAEPDVPTEVVLIERNKTFISCPFSNLVLGGSQALSRSLYAGLVPPRRSAEFFSFFAISSKFASILGPLVFALLIDLTGSNRLAIFSLAAFFVAGMLLLPGVDIERGRQRAGEHLSATT